LIKYTKSVLWRAAKRLSYIQDARCLKVKARSYNHCCTGKSNKYYVFWMCVCCLSYPACNAHAPYCHVSSPALQYQSTL